MWIILSRIQTKRATTPIPGIMSRRLHYIEINVNSRSWYIRIRIYQPINRRSLALSALHNAARFELRRILQINRSHLQTAILPVRNV